MSFGGIVGLSQSRVHKTVSHDAVTNGRPRLRLSIGLGAVRRLQRIHGLPLSRRIGRDMAMLGAWLSLFDRLQRRAWRARLDQAVLTDPVFIIGHWRSGTTLLHELLCADPAFAFPTTHACMNPQHFLWSSAGALQHRGAGMRRPMDGMAITPASPQEDEFALLCLGCSSPYEALLYPQCLPDLFDLADPTRLDAAEQALWRQRFLDFLKGVSLLGGGRPLVLKSPAHSLRVPFLRQMLPGARFIHIVRDPAAVYGSTIRLWQMMMAAYAVGPPIGEADLRDAVRRNMADLDDAVMRDTAGLGPERCQRIRYEQLVADPVATVELLYRTLGLGPVEPVAARLGEALASRGEHRVAPVALDPEALAALQRDCGRLFERHGYALPASGACGQ